MVRAYRTCAPHQEIHMTRLLPTALLLLQFTLGACAAEEDTLTPQVGSPQGSDKADEQGATRMDSIPIFLEPGESFGTDIVFNAVASMWIEGAPRTATVELQLGDRSRSGVRPMLRSDKDEGRLALQVTNRGDEAIEVTIEGVALNPLLLTTRNCLACHTETKKLVGPSFHEIALKYAGNESAERRLTQTLGLGTVGQFGQIPMPPMELRQSEREDVIRYVLGTK